MAKNKSVKPGQNGYKVESGHKLYTVKSGDSLWKISQEQCGGKGSMWKETILKFNPWLQEEDRYNQTTDHVLIKSGEVLDISELNSG